MYQNRYMAKTKVFIVNAQTDIDHKLSDCLGTPVSIGKKKSGAPFLKGVEGRVSISHKRKYLTIAISDYPVGVDIERIDPKPTVFKIATKYFGETIEKDDYESFYLSWTKKEAFGKLFEKGISKEVLGMDHSGSTISDEDGNPIYFTSYRFDDYLVTVADYSGNVEFVTDIQTK